MNICTSLYAVVLRLLGLHEIPGKEHHPFIIWCFSLTTFPKPYSDEDSWCSALLQGPCFLLDLPRSGSAAARSWLLVGDPIDISSAEIGNDVVILKRGPDPQPGPDVIKAPGHVGIYAGQDAQYVKLLAGNQNNQVSIATFPKSSILGVRRLTAKGGS